MRLTEDANDGLDTAGPAAVGHVLARCGLAAELVQAGRYEEARDALGDLWRGVGVRPRVEGLEASHAAEALLRCGSLSGWLGSVLQTEGAQEQAKDLLTEARRRFESLGHKVKAAEAGFELGMCYFRLGAYDEARVVLDEALEASAGEPELKAQTLVRRTLVEVWTGRYHDALEILREAQPFFENVSDAVKGRWHGQMALVLRRLATGEGRADYADRAIIEFTAAAFHLERAGHERYCASTLNNLSMLLYQLGRYEEAHENLDRAVRLFERLKDDGLLAQVWETRARVYVAQGEYGRAGLVISDAILVFERGGERALLADALAIRGVALARTGQHEESLRALGRAVEVAREAGATSNAAHAALALIEEHGAERLTDYDLFETYNRADDLLKDTQDAGDLARLRACARLVTRRLSGARVYDKDFSLRGAVLDYEARFIEHALRSAGGSVTHAAKLLGLGHQALTEILKARHKGLQRFRKPPASRKRREDAPRSAAALRGGRRANAFAAAGKTRALSVLVVEDHPVVADVLRDTLEAEGWRVRVFGDGAAALRQLEGGDHYDALVFDHEMPGLTGVELIRHTRALTHRRRTPVVMLSASEVEPEAWRAGADAFLTKPHGISRLSDIISRLAARTE